MRATLLTVVLACAIAATAADKNAAERLGYPPGTKLLIIHADDLAVSHSVDRASFAALARGAVSSASIMVPCPWFPEVAAYAAAHPNAEYNWSYTGDLAGLLPSAQPL